MGNLPALGEIAAVLGLCSYLFHPPPHALVLRLHAMICGGRSNQKQDNNTDIAMMGFVWGFIVMMVFDVAR
jgi:hypothetical protein